MDIIFNNLSDETIAKYKPILAKSTEQTKEEIKNLVDGYYNSVIEKDNNSLKTIVNEINSYIELDVPEFNDYLTFCLLTSINELLVKLYGNDLELYLPNNTDLTFSTANERKAKHYIKKHDLSKEDVELIVKHNVESLEIYALSFLGYETPSLKPKTILPSYLSNETFLLNTNYVSEHEVESTAKLFYAMNYFFNNGVNEND